MEQRSRQRRPKTDPPVVISDPRAIKALAHPARLAVLDELMAGRQLTATECAQVAGLSPSAMSYHLRALEKWGLIERAEASGDGRERPWRSVSGGWRIESAEPRVSAAAETALAARMLDRQRAEVLSWLNQPHDPGTWHDVTTIANSFLWLTEEQAAELSAEMDRLLKAYPRKQSEGVTGSRRVRVGYVLVPSDGD